MNNQEKLIHSICTLRNPLLYNEVVTKQDYTEIPMNDIILKLKIANNCEIPVIILPTLYPLFIRDIKTTNFNFTTYSSILIKENQENLTLALAMFYLYETPKCPVIHKIKISNLGTYYIGPSMILDKDMKPLLVIVFNSKITQQNLYSRKITIYVDPLVFVDKNIVNYYIIKQILPCINMNKTKEIKYFFNSGIIEEEAELQGREIEIKVEPYKDLHTSKIEINDQKKLNTILKDNIDLIIKTI